MLIVTLGISHKLQDRYRRAMPRGARLVMGPVGGFGQTYEALAQSSPSLEQWLVRQAGWNGQERVAVICFSAGCFAPREWLKLPQNRSIAPLAVVLLDGLHGGPSDVCDRSEIAGVVAFGRLARSEPSERLLVVTNTDIQPPYASTSACSKALLDALLISRWQPDEGSTGGVTVLDFGGTEPADHNAQQTEVGPALLSEGPVGAWLQGKIRISPWIYAVGAAVAVTLVGIAVVGKKVETRGVRVVASMA